jgi:hypothetical protein
MDPILTDKKGVPFKKPQRVDFETDLDFIRAVHAFNDRVTNEANCRFAEAFRLLESKKT